MPASTIPPVETRLHSYRIVKMKPKATDDAGRGFDLKGASASSWTRVNNCAEIKKQAIFDAAKYLMKVPEQYEIGNTALEDKAYLKKQIKNYKPNR